MRQIAFYKGGMKAEVKFSQPAEAADERYCLFSFN